MNRRRAAGTVPSAVIAYCEAMEVPAFNAGIVTRYRERGIARARSRPLRVALIVAPVVLLLLALGNIATVVAGVERILQVFSVGARRTAPMTIRVVDLERARADMPFTVVVPPRIAGAPIVTVDEIAGGPSRSNASVIFELHGTAPGREVMIVETKAAKPSATLLSIGGPAETSGLPPLAAMPSVGPGARRPQTSLHGLFGGHAFTPTTWIAHGTRIAIMSPPGLLTPAQIRKIQRAMSR